MDRDLRNNAPAATPSRPRAVSPFISMGGARTIRALATVDRPLRRRKLLSEPARTCSRRRRDRAFGGHERVIFSSIGSDSGLRGRSGNEWLRSFGHSEGTSCVMMCVTRGRQVSGVRRHATHTDAGSTRRARGRCLSRP
ncbi:hypothetical protein EVAR_293_1 [Eumeta japonica]|uniref:Uncharacterized protein n=1 Tax=Eumeta variegata TaxID=151549 RepID=A0A4C1S9C1_EUMVA|nr:hypothetical protein EVAR_293_1 [Eumeta japonica]